MTWLIVLKGGELHGYAYAVRLRDGQAVPDPVAYAWRCNPRCQAGHLSFDVDDPEMPLGRALAYTRSELRHGQHRATYILGDLDPGDAPEIVAVEREPEAVTAR